MHNIEFGRLMDCYGAFLTARQYAILDQYVNEDCSLAEIAQREDISRQGVRDNIKRAEALLQDMEDKLHIARRTRSILEAVENLEAYLRETWRGGRGFCKDRADQEYLRGILWRLKGFHQSCKAYSRS